MFYFALLILFVLILIQDVKFRGVHWVFFPLLLICTVGMGFDHFSWMNIAYNLGFILVLFGSLTLYLTFKEGHLVNITKGYFSWGDILFLLAIIPLFPFFDYMLFFISGTILTLFVHLSVSLFSETKSVPYAGYMSAMAIAFVSFETQIHQFIFELL